MAAYSLLSLKIKLTKTSKVQEQVKHVVNSYRCAKVRALYSPPLTDLYCSLAAAKLSLSLLKSPKGPSN